MSVLKLKTLREKSWKNMRRIASKYPPSCKQRVFSKWEQIHRKCNKALKAKGITLQEILA